LRHPVIDADGHLAEYVPTFLDYLRQVAGPALTERFENAMKRSGWYAMTPEERRAKRVYRPSWWSFPARNSLDRATAMLPALLRARLDELGIDFAVVYTTMGIFLPRIENDEMRQATCRALNVMVKEIMGGHGDRLSGVATIPTYTPQEAIAELDYSVDVLKHKAVNLESRAVRPVPEVARKAPELARYATWLDTLAFESEYDYDPVWRRCADLKVAVASHSDGVWGGRNANNFIFNHLGSFAAAGELFCKALVLGGVTRRFPELNFAFLEGGVAWACELYNGLVARAEKRNRDSIQNYNPAHIDRALVQEMFGRYGADLNKASRARQPFDPAQVPNAAAMGGFEEPADMLDEFSACGIRSGEDVRDLFVSNLYFGSEADDRLVALAFDSRLNAFGANLKAMFSSDIGHWDVLDMRDTVHEAYELVENGILSEDQFRAFTFENPARFHARVNPDFFAGTAVESAVAKLCAAPASAVRTAHA
jgi:predicted TIM-barrel fold metal-dependent hydrolase